MKTTHSLLRYKKLIPTNDNTVRNAQKFLKIVLWKVLFRGKCKGGNDAGGMSY